MTGNEYEDWICGSYEKWGRALSEIIESNNIQHFKRNPIVDSMCCHSGLENGAFFDMLFEKYQGVPSFPWGEIETIDKFGEPYPAAIKIDGVDYQISGVSARYLVIADEILDEIQSHYTSPVKILEIGGGFGGLCAIINILAVHRGIKIGSYGVFDIPAAQKFQSEYLRNVCNFEITHLDNPASFNEHYDFCISCYAMGEFTLELNSIYIEHVLSKIAHGYLLWNAQGHPNGIDVVCDELLKKYLPELTVIGSPILAAPEFQKHITY